MQLPPLSQMSSEHSAYLIKHRGNSSCYYPVPLHDVKTLDLIQGRETARIMKPLQDNVEPGCSITEPRVSGSSLSIAKESNADAYNTAEFGVGG
jgi:hypothetical protein